MTGNKTRKGNNNLCQILKWNLWDPRNLNIVIIVNIECARQEPGDGNDYLLTQSSHRDNLGLEFFLMSLILAQLLTGDNGKF
jgi:hypothetical protein